MGFWPSSWRWLAGMLLCVAASPAIAQEQAELKPKPGFEVVSAKTTLVADVLRLDALFDLRFSESLVEALRSGVSLNLEIEIEVVRERDYLWSTSIASLAQRYQISYQPLTKSYSLNNLNSQVEFQFPSLESLLAVVSVMQDFPLLDRSLLEDEGGRYWGEIRISVDRESFPVPLRLMSYVYGEWHLSSEWFEWSLLP